MRRCWKAKLFYNSSALSKSFTTRIVKSRRSNLAAFLWTAVATQTRTAAINHIGSALTNSDIGEMRRGMSETGPIIVFDGLCVLCSANAQFVLKHDKSGHFRLAAMQGQTGSALFIRFGIDPKDPNTIIVVDGDMVWRNSDAVLKI